MGVINVRIDKDIKAKAGKTLSALGLDTSTAVRMFLHQVVADKGFPFTPTRNPAATRAQWDKAVAAAKRTSPRYKNAKEALADL